MLYVSRYDFDLIEITDSETGSIEVMSRSDSYMYYKNSRFTQKEIRGVVPVCGLYFYSASPKDAYIRALSKNDLVGIEKLEKMYRVDCAKRKLLGFSNKFSVAIVDSNLCVLVYSDESNFYIPSYVTSIERDCFRIGADTWKNDEEHIIKIPSNIKIISSSFCDSYKQVEKIVFEGDLYFLGNDVFRDCPCLSSITFNGNIDYISDNCFKRFNGHGRSKIRLREEVYNKHKQAFNSFGAGNSKIEFL